MSTPEFESHRCWVCGGRGRPFRQSTIRERVDTSSVRITDSNYGQTAALSKCDVCGFVFADPIPHDDVLGLYVGMEDESYQHTSAARRAQMRVLLQFAQQVRPGARTLLDIGAGTGLLVSEARAIGFDAQGIEPSRWCVATAASANGVELLCGTTQDWADRVGRFDIVTLVDVIEHTTDPIAMLRDAAALVAPGGALLIVTPDIGSVAARVMGRWWWHHRIAHVGYFSKPSMHRALHEVGMMLEAETAATWKFPLAYVAERLLRYMPVFPVSTLLRVAARSTRAQAWRITVNLHDSRAFIASIGAASA